MNFVRTFLLLFAAISIQVCSGYRILGIYPYSGTSHFMLLNQLFKGLSRKGHQVDLISVLPVEGNNPNYTRIIELPDRMKDVMSSLTSDNSQAFNKNLMILMADIGYKMCENMGIPEFLSLARNPPKDPPYDAIITQTLCYPCFMILGHLWNIPVIVVSTSSLYPWMHHMIGNPDNTAISSNNFLPVPEGNGFWSRFVNTYTFYHLKFSYLYHTMNQNQLLQKYFGPNAPTVHELEESTSLILMNTYFPLNGIKPTTTGLVEIGGLHIQNEGPKLTDHLKNWLDESTSGVIYFTLGSWFRIENIPMEKLDIIFKSLENIAPIRVLMRIARPEDLNITIPKNFYHLPWMPQEKILQHKNVKAFITHAGLLGTQESIYYGVPMICFPLVVDQWNNANIYESKKIAVALNFVTFTRDQFDSALNEILNKPIYRENVKRLSRLFRDRPQSAMDTAAFWIEFVIRNGKDSLRSPAMDLTWWQVALLDVYAVMIVISITVVYVILKILRLFLKHVIQNTKNKEKIN